MPVIDRRAEPEEGRQLATRPDPRPTKPGRAGRVRIGFLMQRYSPAGRSHMPDVVGLLAEAGAMVEVIHAEEWTRGASKLRVRHDLYVLKDKTEIALSLAGALHALGAQILNPYPVSTILRDKIATFRVLQAAGVPTPETYAVTDPRQLIPLLDAGPLVVKPYRGSRGRGVRVVLTAAGLDAMVPREEPIFAQRYHPPNGRDRKMYGIGGEVFGVKRVWPATTHEEKIGEPFPVSPELAEITRRCGRALGIDLIGVDIVESGGVPYVVDASSFPGFKGVADAPSRLAKYIYAAAEAAARGKPPVVARATGALAAETGVAPHP